MWTSYAANADAPFPPAGWALVDGGDAYAAAVAGELAPGAPDAPAFVDDVDDAGTVRRFFTVAEGDRVGVACLRWDGAGAAAGTLGDASASSSTPATASLGASSSSSSSAWAWVLGLLAVAGVAGGLWYAFGRGRRAHASSSERRQERDEFAAANIPPELAHLWRRERSRFHGSPDERAEAFLEWAETGEGQNALAELLEERGRREWERKRLEREGCACNDEDSPHCCGRGCCSYHKGIRGRVDSEVPF